MNCDEALARVSARLDEELGAAEAHALDAHLRDCQSCQLRATALERAEPLLRGQAPSGHVDAGAVDRIMATLPDEAAPPATSDEPEFIELFVRWARPAAALAAVAALVSLAGALAFSSAGELLAPAADDEAVTLASTEEQALSSATATLALDEASDGAEEQR